MTPFQRARLTRLTVAVVLTELLAVIGWRAASLSADVAVAVAAGYVIQVAVVFAVSERTFLRNPLFAPERFWLRMYGVELPQSTPAVMTPEMERNVTRALEEIARATSLEQAVKIAEPAIDAAAGRSDVNPALSRDLLALKLIARAATLPEARELAARSLSLSASVR